MAMLIGKPLKGSQAAVYRLMENGRLRKISDWPTFLALGYHPGEIVQIPDQDLASYPLDSPLTRWLMGQVGSAIYWLKAGQRYRVPDATTTEVMGGDALKLSCVTDEFLAHFYQHILV